VRRWEVVLVVLGVALGLVEAAFEPNVTWCPVAAAMVVVLVPLVLVRRTRPLTVVLLIFGVQALVDGLVWLTDEGTTLVGVTFVASVTATYAVARWGSGREISVGAPAVVLLSLVSDPTDDVPFIAALVSSTLWLLVVAVGIIVRTRGSRRRERVEAARLSERELLARELHDTVAHHVSAIAIQAQAGRLMAQTDPASAAGVLETIEDAASQTLSEMRRLVSALRDHAEAELRPQASLDDLSALGEVAGPGPAIELDVIGDAERVAPSLAASVFRVAQEAVTNARRHARNASVVRVEIRIVRDEVHVSVVDDGDAVASAAGRGSGYGLIGMQERAELLGGTFEAGPHEPRGWEVRAILPNGEGR